MKLALIDGKKLIRLLNDRGFAVKRQKGGHVQLEDDIGRRITIPLHPGRQIGSGLLRKILRDAEMTRGEYERLGRKA